MKPLYQVKGRLKLARAMAKGKSVANERFGQVCVQLCVDISMCVFVGVWVYVCMWVTRAW